MPIPLNQENQKVKSLGCHGNGLAFAKEQALGRVQLKSPELVRMLDRSRHYDQKNNSLRFLLAIPQDLQECKPIGFQAARGKNSKSSQRGIIAHLPWG